MIDRRRGVLVAVEGIDGAGKTTLQRRLARAWRAQGYTVESVREPANRALGSEALRVSSDDPAWAAALFTLDRWAARPRLRALLRQRVVVLSDRSFYSTLAYQGSALSARRRRELERLERRVAEIPDRVILLEVSTPEGLRRVGRRGRVRAPSERKEFLDRVQRAYRSLSQRDEWVVLDAEDLPEALAQEAARRLSGLLRHRLGPPRRDS